MIRLFFITVFGLTAYTSQAQAPQKITFQSIVRNSSDVLITSSTVGMQMSILQGSPTGLAAYIETHTPTTNINGLATIEIGGGTPVAGSFSSIDWANGPYYIKTEVDPNGGTSYTISGTTQLLSVPYALYAESTGSTFSGDYNDLTNTPTNLSDFTNDVGFITSPNDADSDPANEIQSLSLVGNNLSISGGNTVVLSGASGNTLDQSYDQGGAGAGRVITVDAGEVEMNTSSANGIALRTANSNTGVAHIASSTNSGNTFSTIQSTTNSNSSIASALIGSSSGAAWGVSGQIEAAASGQAAVYGSNLRNNGGHGVLGIGYNGIVGETNYRDGFGVYGHNYDALGPLTSNAVGTYGLGYIGVWGDDLGTGGFSIYANGDLGAAGFKSFQIDHPADPENKYLKHFSIESDEVLNMYRGTIPFDANGEAIVELPDYVALVNVNYSYTLTPVGAYAPLYVKEEISNGKFVIAGGNPSMKVSWVVYGERNDPYAVQNSDEKIVEPEKEDWNKGKYLKPELYGQSDDLKIVKPLPPAEQRTLNIHE